MTALAPESLEGAVRLGLYDGESETFEPSKLKVMGNNGPIMLIKGDKSIMKLYAFTYDEEGEQKIKYAVTSALFNNDEVDDHFIPNPITYLDGALRTAQFDIEGDEIQVRVTDKSSTKDVGTSVIVKKKEQKPGEFARVLSAQLGKRIVGRVAEDK